MDDSTSSNGYHALAVQLAETTTFPSWGYMYAQNATTLWEQWIDTYLPSDGASHNHVMFGSIDEWLYDYYAGIRSDGSVDLHYLCDSRTTSSFLIISGDDRPYYSTTVLQYSNRQRPYRFRPPHARETQSVEVRNPWRVGDLP